MHRTELLAQYLLNDADSLHRLRLAIVNILDYAAQDILPRIKSALDSTSTSQEPERAQISGGQETSGDLQTEQSPQEAPVEKGKEKASPAKGQGGPSASGAGKDSVRSILLRSERPRGNR